MLETRIDANGDVIADDRVLGRVVGFRFSPSTAIAAESEMSGELSRSLSTLFQSRVGRLKEAVDESLTLSNDGLIRWLGDPIAKVVAGERLLAPRTLILTDPILDDEQRAAVSARVDLWLAAQLKRQLGALADFDGAADLKDDTQAIVRSVIQSAGIVDRAKVSDKVKRLQQDDRGALRKLGLRFGAHYIFLPSLLKPAPRAMAALLWALVNGREEDLGDVLQFAGSGRTSFAVDKDLPADLLLAAGFRLCGDRAVRIDIVERIADLIRHALSSTPNAVADKTDARSASPGPGYFVITQAMTSLAGCSSVQFRSILNSLNFESELKAVEKVAPRDVRDDATSIVARPDEPPVDPQGDPTVPSATSDGEDSPALEPAEVEAAPSTPLDAETAGPSEAKETTQQEVWRIRRFKPAAHENNARGRRSGRPKPVPAVKNEAQQAPTATEEQGRGAGRREQRAGRGLPQTLDDGAGSSPHRGGGRSGKPSMPRGRGEQTRPALHAPPVRKEVPVDLNSPFAKLLALKAQLEIKGKS